MLRITDNLALEEGDLEEAFVRASGPGGQNVNKVSSAVQLRFRLATCHALDARVRARLVVLAKGRLTEDGCILIDARRHRTQERNRQDARERLAELIRAALTPPRPRRPTRPTRASRVRRLDAKRHQAERKSTRRKIAPED